MPPAATLLTSATLESMYLVVALPQRQPPQRIVLGRGMPRDVGGERVVVGVEGRQLGAERDARGAGQRAHVDQQVGRLLVGQRQRVGQDQPAFGVGVADLDGEALARAVDVERPEGVAGNRILDRRDQHAQPKLGSRASMIMCAQRQHGRGAAHVLLHDQHAAFGLDVEPAGVEADALADQRDLGIGRHRPSACRSAAARGSVGGAADGMDQRKVLLSAGRRRRSRGTSRRAAWPSARAAASSSAGPMSLAGVLIRSRASVDALGDAGEVVAVDAVGQHQPDVLVLGLAVAREAIGAEREGERGEPRIVRRIGEPIGAGRQQRRQAPARQECVVGASVRVSSPNSTPARPPSADGSIRCRPAAARSRPPLRRRGRACPSLATRKRRHPGRRR